MSRPAQRTRIAIVDEHVLFVECLAIALEARGYDCRRLSVPGAPRASSSLVTTIGRTRPDIVLLNIDLGASRDGGALIEPLARSGAQVVVVTENLDRARWGEALLHGASTVLPKSSALNTVAAAIGRLAAQAPAMSRTERAELVWLYRHEAPEHRVLRARLARLTAREREILSQLMTGRHVSEIAGTYVVSESTVRTQVKSILLKLEVSSQIAAVGAAHRAGWRPQHGHTEAARASA